ncbi:MAG: PfkB family carbohydrate kinase, partial [Tepidisphaeraceae bacterium]
MDKRWDILGVGCTAVDDLLYVINYPPADAKIAVQRRERQCGGLAATALVAAARQEAQCAYAGALGHDELSAFVLKAMLDEGIDVSPAGHHSSAGPFHSTIIVDQTVHTRNIFFTGPEIVGPLPTAPSEDTVRAARVLLVDHYGGEATVRAQRLARQANIPIVADLERNDRPAFAEILRYSDHLIISERFAASLTGREAPDDAAAALLGPDRRVVVVTCGAGGCWAIEQGESKPRHYAAFAVQTVDTTGCGDTFRFLDLVVSDAVNSASAWNWSWHFLSRQPGIGGAEYQSTG